MRDLIIKILRALADIEREKGEFVVKCLVSKNLENNVWDLVLAADWFAPDQKERITYLSDKILADFDEEIISHFSGVIALSPDKPLARFLSEMQSADKGCSRMYVSGYPVIQSDHEVAQFILPLGDLSISKAA